MSCSAPPDSNPPLAHRSCRASPPGASCSPGGGVLLGRLKDVFYMPNDSKLYLCFEYCDYDLKKYMKSCQYKLSANCIKAPSPSPP